MYAQIPLKSKGFTKTQHGYIYFKKGWERFLTFVPLKSDSITNDLSNFDEKNLGVGFQLNNYSIITDSLSKYGKSYKLENSRNDSVITIVPITITYRIDRYAMTKEQLKKSTHDWHYIISGKPVTLRNIGGISLIIISSTPMLYYYDSWE
jgi:hypothetical protein